MTSAGQEFAMIMHISGSWSTIAKLEAALPNLGKKHNLSIESRRTQPKTQSHPILPYAIQIIGLDKPGILGEIAHFFSSESIMIHTLTMDTQILPSSHSQIVSINLTIQIPAKTHLATLRERFLEYCEDRNLDALMEPECA
jgi:glycine cleavage system transcriptional repressor